MPAESRTIVTAHDGSILSKNGYGLYINPFRNFGSHRIRFQFDDLNHDPTSVYPDGTTEWIRVSYSPNIWDYYHASNDWGGRFGHGGGASPAIRNAPCSILIANLEGVTNIAGIFYNYRSNPSYAMYIHDVYNFYAPDVTSVIYAFYNCKELETCDIISLGAPEAGNNIFAGCSSLKKAPYFCTSNMRNGSSMFSGCSSLVDVPLYDMSNMTDIQNCFFRCSSLVHVPEFQTGSVRHFKSLFEGCTALQESPNFNTENAVSLAFMYDNCTSLRRAPTLNTESVRQFAYMFSGCTALTYVPLYDTSAMTSDPLGDCDFMFSECSNVSGGALDLYNQIIASGWQPAYYDCYRDAFRNCGILTESGHRDLEQIPKSWGGLKEN